MNEYYEKLKAWKSLMNTLEKIPDPCLQQMYKNTFILKAQEEWGFNPENVNERPVKKELSEQDLIKYLDPWEKELLERIKIYNEYGIDTKPKEELKKEEQEIKEAKKNMFEFIKNGGTLVDIPTEIRTDGVTKLYFEALKKVYGIE